MASPTLLFNIYGSVVPSGSSVTLRASPFGSRRPTIPTARSVTIARVASPLSTDRGYQSLFLNALKRYFGSNDGPSRLVKQGDIISTNIDTDSLRNLASLMIGEDDVTEVEIADYEFVFLLSV
jgi:peroxin-6